MKKQRIAAAGFLLALALYTPGSAAENPSRPPADKPTKKRFADPPQYAALHTTSPLTIDGKLDEKIWKSAPAHGLVMPDQLKNKGHTLRDPGSCRFLWNEEYLYVGIEFTDGDVIARGTGNHQHHYMLGDLAELFIYRESAAAYHELYVTPAGYKTCFYFSKPGGKLEIRKDCSLRVAAVVRGTFNKSDDRDKGWVAEFAVPAKVLLPQKKLAANQVWRVLVGRYNYAKKDTDLTAEISSAPWVPYASFHSRKRFARLTLQR